MRRFLPILFLLLFCGAAVAQTLSPSDIQTEELSLWEQEVVSLTNAERIQRGLNPLAVDFRLVEAARSHSAWMARTRVFEHSRIGYGENIAAGQDTPSEVVQAWMNSPGHRENILKPRYTRIGVAVVRSNSSNRWLYWTQEFMYGEIERPMMANLPIPAAPVPDNAPVPPDAADPPPADASLNGVSPLYQAAYATALWIGEKTTGNTTRGIESSCVIAHYDRDTGVATVITAAHCYEPGYEFYIWPQGHEQKYAATVTWVSRDTSKADLAVATFRPTSPVYTIPGIVESSPPAGSGVMLLGYPEASRTLRGTWGTVIDRQFDWISSTCRARQGDSGGALVDENGLLVGIQSAGDDTEGIAVNIETIRKLVYSAE